MQGYFAKQRNDYFDEIVRGSRVQQYIHDLLTSRQAANEVRVFSLAPYLVGRFLGYAKAQFARFWTRERRILTAEVVMSVLSLVGTAAIWVFAIGRAVVGRITLGDLTLVFTASIQCRTQLEALVGSTGEVLEHSLLAARYFQFLDLDPESVSGTLTPPQTPSRPMPKPLAGQVALRDVSFAYPGSERRVLERLSFVIPSGAKVAIGGEWQFLAIARALMSNAKILILDEPTAALDALKEQELYERFATLTEDRTVVFISHRFSTVRMADIIVVLDDGRVVESGSHDELIAFAGKYARMYETQAARYAMSNSATEPRP